MFDGTSSSDGGVDCCIIIIKLIDSILTHDGNRNRHTNDLVEHKEVFFLKIAYSRYDVHSEMF
jgi:tRNA(Arg) A34 adenosine deaminase TadA